VDAIISEVGSLKQLRFSLRIFPPRFYLACGTPHCVRQTVLGVSDKIFGENAKKRICLSASPPPSQKIDFKPVADIYGTAVPAVAVQRFAR
jgi:hypothetical protein